MCKAIDDYTDTELLDELNTRKIPMEFLIRQVYVEAESEKCPLDILKPVDDWLKTRSLTKTDLENWKAGKAKVV